MVGLIDCDNFFCSCERVFRPDLDGRPIVVLSNNDGCVVARSAEAKSLGVKEGLPYYQLLDYYPTAGIVAFSSNYSLYGDMSARVMAILREEAPGVTQYSIDEAFLDLDGIDTSQLKKWGESLCTKILKNTGLPVSLGIAPTKTLAKIASRFAKRYAGYNKCCLIADDAQREAALRLTSIGDVWGIGRRISSKLERYNITTALDFTHQPQWWVRAKFNITCERTWRELIGERAIEVDGLDGVEKKSIMTSRSFPGMISDIEDLSTHVANYAARCAMKLRRQNSVCSLVTLFIQSNHFREDLEQYNATASDSFLTATNTTNEIVAAALKILPVIFKRGIFYKRAGIMVSGISPANRLQPDLFTYQPDRSRQLSGVSQTLDNINNHLGADTIVLGAQQYREKASDGKSVKFVNAIKRALKSPDYSTSLGALMI